MARCATPDVGHPIIERTRLDNSRIDVRFVSVDGDEWYNQYFESSFQVIRTRISEGFDAETLCDSIYQAKPFWVSAFLHLLKNARTRLFRTEICVNPAVATDGTYMAQIATYFGDSLMFSDISSLGKMRDSYPLDLFTLARAFPLKEVGNADEFLYLFVLALWAEAIENHKFDLNTRVVIIETLLLFLLN
jgi:hypothetical protein